MARQSPGCLPRNAGQDARGTTQCVTTKAAATINPFNLPIILHGSRLQRDATPIRTQRGDRRDLPHPPASSLGNTQPATSKRKRTLSPLKCSRTRGKRGRGEYRRGAEMEMRGTTSWGLPWHGHLAHDASRAGRPCHVCDNCSFRPETYRPTRCPASRAMSMLPGRYRNVLRLSHG